MRVLRLVADGRYAVELHPYVTVVTDMTEEQREEIIAAVRAAVAGRTTELDGLLEVHGVVLDLDGRTLDLLDLGQEAVDVVVDASDLPGGASAGLGRQLQVAERRLEALEAPYRERSRAVEAAEAARTAAEEELVRARRAAEAGAGGDDDVDDEGRRLEQAVRDAEDAVARLAGPGTRASGELEQAERALVEAEYGVDAGRGERLRAEREALEDRRNELVGALDEGAAEAFEHALAELRRLEGGDDVALGPDPADPAVAEARIEEIEGTLALQRSFDSDRVRAALDAVRLDSSEGEMMPSAEALSIADRLETVDRRIVDLEARGEPPAPDAVEASSRRLEEIRGAIVEIERAASTSSLAADIEELERTHAEVVEAGDRLDTRFGRGRAQARYEAAVAAEAAVLSRLGVRSYTDFMTGGRDAVHADAEPEELGRLRREEREVAAELLDLESRAGVTAELAEAIDDRRRLRARARTLLGTPTLDDDELPGALLALRVPAGAASPLDELSDALEEVGLPVRSLELSGEDVEAMAADWLDEYLRAEVRRSALEAELEALRRGVAGEPADPMDIGPDLAGADAAAEQRPMAQDAVRRAKERMIGHEAAVRELESLDVEREALEGAELDDEGTRRRVAEAEAAVAAARSEVERLEAERNEAERRVSETRAALEEHRVRVASRRRELEQALDAATTAVSHACRALEVEEEGHREARATYDAAVEEVVALRQAVSDVADQPAPIEEIEWYLLARLAAQRQLSFAGSVPMIVDRALDAVEGEGIVALLERLERMAGAVQVIHLTDDDRVVQWAQAAGEQRVAVVRPAAAVVSD